MEAGKVNTQWGPVRIRGLLFRDFLSCGSNKVGRDNVIAKLIFILIFKEWIGNFNLEIGE